MSRPEDNLFQQVTDFHSLCQAARRAAKGKHTREIEDFLIHLEPEVLQLQRLTTN